jgi:hypothetical protein
MRKRCFAKVCAFGAWPGRRAHAPPHAPRGRRSLAATGRLLDAAVAAQARALGTRN